MLLAKKWGWSWGSGRTWGPSVFGVIRGSLGWAVITAGWDLPSCWGASQQRPPKPKTQDHLTLTWGKYGADGGAEPYCFPLRPSWSSSPSTAHAF